MRVTLTLVGICTKYCSGKYLSSMILSPQLLPDEQSREMCQRFADMEAKLGEIDRARAVYSFCSQMCDPRVSILIDGTVKANFYDS